MSPDEKFRAVMSGFVLLFMAAYSYLYTQSYPEQIIPQKQYSGVISFWDISLTSVKGSKYSVIKTICSEFASKKATLMVEFSKINEISPIESVKLAFNQKSSPFDVIRSDIYGYKIDESEVLAIDAAAQRIRSLYHPGFAERRGADNKLIVDYCCDIKVIIFNDELLYSYGKTHLNNDYEIEELYALLDEGKKLFDQDPNKSIDTVGYCNEMEKDYAPFEACGGKECINRITGYSAGALQESRESIRDKFLRGETLMICGDLKFCANLQRQKLNGSGFDFSVYMFPGEQKKVFVKDIVSYAFIESSTEEKNAVLCELAEYMLTQSASEYVQNLGLLPCADIVLLYPELSYMTDIAQYYREAQIIVE